MPYADITAKLMEAQRHVRTDPTNRGCLRAALFTLSAARTLSTNKSLTPRFSSLQEHFITTARLISDDPIPITSRLDMGTVHDTLLYAQEALDSQKDKRDFPYLPFGPPLVHSLLRATVALVVAAKLSRSIKKTTDLMLMQGIDE